MLHYSLYTPFSSTNIIEKTIKHTFIRLHPKQLYIIFPKGVPNLLNIIILYIFIFCYSDVHP